LAYNPAFPTDRDYLRWFMQDTDDLNPALGLSEAGYDALIARVGANQAAIALIDQRLAGLGPEMVVDGDRTDMINRQYMFWENRKKQLMSGEIQIGGAGSYDPGAVGKMAHPDLTNYKEL
jgi:hypothetical protein